MKKMWSVSSKYQVYRVYYNGDQELVEECRTIRDARKAAEMAYNASTRECITTIKKDGKAVR